MEGLGDILTVLIGLVFIYLILSIIVSYLVELIASVLKLRSANLANAIQLLLDPSTKQFARLQNVVETAETAVGEAWYKVVGPQGEVGGNIVPFVKNNLQKTPLVGVFFAHPTIAALSRPKELPSYINSTDFTTALLDILHIAGGGSKQLPAVVVSAPLSASVPLPASVPLIGSTPLPASVPLPADLHPAQIATQASDLAKEVAEAAAASNAAAIATEVLHTTDQLTEANAEAFFNSIKKGLDNLGNNPLKAALLPYIQQAEMTTQTAEQRVEMLRNSIAGWYDSTMERATGWYKRYATIIALCIAMIVAVALNADTIDIFQRLWSDANLRQVVATAAVNYTTHSQQVGMVPAVVAGTSTTGTGTGTTQASAPAPVNIDQTIADIQKLQNTIPVPLGWSQFPPRDAAGSLPDPAKIFWLTLFKVVGILVTGLAISQGSSLWFQTLNGLINLRNTGIPPEPAGPSKTTSRRKWFRREKAG